MSLVWRVDLDLVISSILTIVTAATPLVFAAQGELVVEKSGVLNLGVEGMMIMGAISAFATAVGTGSAILAILAGAAAGALAAALFGGLVLWLKSNQVATGLALTIFGLGLSALLGHSLVGKTFVGLPRDFIPLLSDIPILGRLVFGYDAMVYLSLFSVLAIVWFLNRTRLGLILRAVGENHDAAHAIGYPVILIRFMAILFGGAMAGLGGAYLSIVYTPLWVENMTAGRGWIALALVVFATWKPWRAFLGAYLFGGISILQLHIQGFGIDMPSQILSMLPYLVTIVVLVIISRDAGRLKLSAPACLGKIFHAST
ncbi:MAG: ABC transporter permease [Gammaproteobacteria bacterium]|nr:ABC transporter permease [Gammaproteobacteria bacterium]